MADEAGPKRKTPPLGVKLASALIQLEAAMRRLGEIPADVTKVDWQFDHHPPLATRPVLPDGSDWDPPQHDPTKLYWMWHQAHHDKTYGTNGATSVGSDRHAIDHTRRVRDKELEFVKRILSKEPGRPPEKKGTIKGRGFEKRPKLPKAKKTPKRSAVELARMNAGKKRT